MGYHWPGSNSCFYYCFGKNAAVIHKEQKKYQKLQTVFYSALGIIIFSGFVWMYYQSTQFRNTVYQSRGLAPIPTIKQDPMKDWQIFSLPLLGFSFKYPQDKFTVTDNDKKGVNLVRKIELVSKDASTRVAVLVWNKPVLPITKDSIETWCKNTLKREAAEEDVLCALLSPQALSKINIFGKTIYQTKYYSSFNEQIEFFIIPQSNYIFTASVVTPNNGENQTPLLLRILSTFKFTN